MTTTEHSGSGDVSRSLELLWGLDERPSRGPKPGLTLDRIVTTAVAVADADGLGALSMRRVATDLGVGTMSLYRYVPGKAELLDLMLDKVAEFDADAHPDPAAGWRPAMEALARGSRQQYQRHPGCSRSTRPARCSAPTPWTHWSTRCAPWPAPA